MRLSYSPFWKDRVYFLSFDFCLGRGISFGNVSMAEMTVPTLCPCLERPCKFQVALLILCPCREKSLASAGNPAHQRAMPDVWEEPPQVSPLSVKHPSAVPQVHELNQLLFLVLLRTCGCMSFRIIAAMVVPYTDHLKLITFSGTAEVRSVPFFCPSLLSTLHGYSHSPSRPVSPFYQA